MTSNQAGHRLIRLLFVWIPFFVCIYKHYVFFSKRKTLNSERNLIWRSRTNQNLRLEKYSVLGPVTQIYMGFIKINLILIRIRTIDYKSANHSIPINTQPSRAKQIQNWHWSNCQITMNMAAIRMILTFRASTHTSTILFGIFPISNKRNVFIQIAKIFFRCVVGWLAVAFLCVNLIALQTNGIAGFGFSRRNNIAQSLVEHP